MTWAIAAGASAIAAKGKLNETASTTSMFIVVVVKLF